MSDHFLSYTEWTPGDDERKNGVEQCDSFFDEMGRSIDNTPQKKKANAVALARTDAARATALILNSENVREVLTGPIEDLFDRPRDIRPPDHPLLHKVRWEEALPHSRD